MSAQVSFASESEGIEMQALRILLFDLNSEPAFVFGSLVTARNKTDFIARVTVGYKITIRRVVFHGRGSENSNFLWITSSC